MGKKNGVFSQREILRALYANKLDKILVRENGKVDYKLYKKDKEDKFYVYMKVPSEVIAKFYYDVVIEFSPPDNIHAGVSSIDSYKVRFFSNDPAFVFTFAHAFIENDLFLTELSSKMSKPAIKNTAEIRNPKNEVGYVKSLFFAYLIMNQRGLFKKVLYLTADEINFKVLIPLIMHADKKIQLRQEAQTEYDKKARINKKLAQNKDKSKTQIQDEMRSKDSVVRTTNPAKTVSTTKKSKIAKAVKKVAKRRG